MPGEKDVRQTPENFRRHHPKHYSSGCDPSLVCRLCSEACRSNKRMRILKVHLEWYFSLTGKAMPHGITDKWFIPWFLCVTCYDHNQKQSPFQFVEPAYWGEPGADDCFFCDVKMTGNIKYIQKYANL